MIIDLILDRYNGAAYVTSDFYINVLEYENIFELSHDITIAMDFSTNKEVQQALCKYIDDNNYNANIKAFINAVNWLADDVGKDYTVLYPLYYSEYCVSDSKYHDYTNTDHCNKCIKCAVIAYQEIQNIDINAHIQKKVKEVYPDKLMQEITNNTKKAIFDIIDCML